MIPYRLPNKNTKDRETGLFLLGFFWYSGTMEKIFEKKRPVIEKIENAGFKKENEKWVKWFPILGGEFRLEVEITNQNTSYKVIDTAFDEEYIGYKVGEGEFVLRMKEEMERVLEQLVKTAYEDVWFVNHQANRIAIRIKEAYDDVPEFLFKNDEDTGVFRNPGNEKWYGIVLNKKEGEKSKTLLNVKLDKKKVAALQKRAGYEPAYHMNKTYWISIVLDDTLEDDEIMDRIKESRSFTETSTRSWVIPSKPDIYDVRRAFSRSKEITWHRKANFQVDDLVFIYVSAPIQKIQFACKVTSIDPDHKTMKIKILKAYNEEFPIELLKRYGLKAVRGARHVPKELEGLLMEGLEDE